jgi:putative spermidine/putrescine transport system permease protein
MTEKLPTMLPKTFKAMKGWDGQDLPSEEVFEAFYLDMKLLIEERREGKLSTQMNFTKNGFKSIIKKLRREMRIF